MNTTNSKLKLSQNFWLNEFTKEDPTPFQLSLLKILAKNIQTVRNKLNENVSWRLDQTKEIGVAINNGVRTAADYARLKAAGWKPSPDSDHMCGLSPFSAKPTLGAADTDYTNTNLSNTEIFKKIVEWSEQGVVNFGQIIHEYASSGKSDWIHLATHWNDVFTDKVLANPRQHYLISDDGGATYKFYKV